MATADTDNSPREDGAPDTPTFPGLGRYHRQMLLPGVGEEGQRRLLESRALIVGCGALGTVIADLLTRAGVGTLTIVDRDVVEATNLQRQTLFDEKDAAEGVPKAEAAARKLRAINSGVRIEAVVADFGPRTAEKIARGGRGEMPGVIVDGTDNFQTRYLLNDLAVARGVPYIYGGAVGTAGMSMTIVPGRTPCLRCIFPDLPAPGSTPTCDTAGVLGPATAMVGAYEAAEAIKVLLGRMEALSRGLVQFDLWGGGPRRIDLGEARPDCPCCGQRTFPFLDGSIAARATVLCGRDSVQVNPSPESIRSRLDLETLAQRLAEHGSFEATRLLVRGRLREEGLELTVFPDARAIIRGTTEPGIAMAVYARYVGV